MYYHVKAGDVHYCCPRSNRSLRTTIVSKNHRDTISPMSRNKVNGALSDNTYERRRSQASENFQKTFWHDNHGDQAHLFDGQRKVTTTLSVQIWKDTPHDACQVSNWAIIRSGTALLGVLDVSLKRNINSINFSPYTRSWCITDKFVYNNKEVQGGYWNPRSVFTLKQAIVCSVTRHCMPQTFCQFRSQTARIWKYTHYRGLIKMTKNFIITLKRKGHTLALWIQPWYELK